MAGWFGGAPVLWAGDPLWDAQTKLLAKRAAEADAYRKLAETVKGLHLTSDTLVRDFVAESDLIRTDLDNFVKGIRLGDPTWYEDGSCEVPAEVTVARVVNQLKEIHTRHYQGDAVKGTDFENINKSMNKDVIQVVGLGAPRPDLPPDLPEGIEEVITPVPDLAPTSPIPELWLQMGAQARLMAVRAAELDGQRRLLERIKGLRLTSDTQVRDFVAEWDRIQSEASGLVVGARIEQTYYHHDEPIVEVTFSVPVESVITTINELRERHYQGDRVTRTDVNDVRKQLKNPTFQATGMGVPPQKYIAKAVAVMEIPVPDWATDRIQARGYGTDPAIDTPQGKLKAARVAELDAKRKLAEQIYDMRISTNTRVRDFVIQYDEIGAQVDSILMGAMIDRTEWRGDTAEVTVSVPGMEVWQVISGQMKINKRRGG
jgi:hypothetical protein